MPTTPLRQIFAQFRSDAKTEREKGNYFEELIRTYLRYEPVYAELYSDVWLLNEVPPKLGISKQDAGIDLVARTRSTNQLHAIQCKFYDEEHRIQKADIDSFFTASGQKPFTHRVIVSSTNHWGEKAEAALFNQQPPVSVIDLHDLENSQIEWAKYKGKKKPALKPKYKSKPHQKSAISAVMSGLKKSDRGKLIMA